MIGRLVHDEGGMTIAELLIGAVLMLVVMGTAFGALQQFESTSTRNTRQNEAQDRARQAIDLMVKRLRNDAAPTPGSPQGVDRATAEDLIFQSADPHPPEGASDNSHNVMRVRYCLDDSDPQNQKIWAQQQRWTSAVAPAAAASASCPDPSWGDQHVIADNVVNNLAQSPRPVWTIDCPAGYSEAVCAAGTDHGMLAKVKRVAIEIFVDRNPGSIPAESRLSTSVYFRNQNARPTAVLTPAAVQPVGGRVLANASASSDPDADRLSYRWCYYGTNTPSSTWCANGTEIAQRTVAIDHIVSPAPAPGTTVQMGLRVQDPGGLVAYDNEEVTIR